MSCSSSELAGQTPDVVEPASCTVPTSDPSTLASMVTGTPTSAPETSVTPALTIIQQVYLTPKEHKIDSLVQAIKAEHMERVLVLSRTKLGADKIAHRLGERSLPAVAMHSDRTQGQRERGLEEFRRGRIRVVVATDIGIRGIELSKMSHVINYDIPVNAEDYVERISQLENAGCLGSVITFISTEEQEHLRRIEKSLGRRFSVQRYPGRLPAKVKTAISNERPRVSGVTHTKPRPQTRLPKQPHRKRAPVLATRKKKPAGKLESFSSSLGDVRYS